MRIAPDDIELELPRAIFGGLRRDATEELLRRVAHDYAMLHEENKKLRATVAGLERNAGEPVAEPQPELVSREAPKPSEPAPGRERDELDRKALALAQRAAKEMRASARLDCDLMLKKVSLRARSLELDTERARASNEAELAELELLRREISERMRAALQAVLEPPPLPAAEAA